ncbi:putative glyoxylase CFP32 [Pilimelia anulata]|uniref:Putative glyoxylase CFP32 n=1 Tax=Pilimelia anulata TaxID=53371 RepID=A0A8J3B4K3_9ACTN|nr:VOC family protein [Pilimelia anulata]GGJ95208.1 putative glyoxylase CFP32 [Pilimelia anulata]
MSSVNGTPIWADLGTSDPAASREFYTNLFGWTAEADPDPQFGGYTTLLKDGKRVAALGPLNSPEQPVVWSTYFGSDDLDGTGKAVEAAGGSVVVPPMAIRDLGRMAFFADPSGAVFGAWEPGTHTGFELTEADGSYCWTELSTTDPAGARAFYPAVFGWATHDNPMAGGGTYTEFKAGGKSLAGLMDGPDGPPAPPHWLVHFAVVDVDGATGRAQGLGAATIVPPTDFPGGRFSILADPQGAAFALVWMDEAPSAHA